MAGIIFKRNHGRYSAGDNAEVSDEHGNYLVLIGVAEYLEQEKDSEKFETFHVPKNEKKVRKKQD